VHLRLLVDEPAAAAWNMAVDEALLLLAAGPTLRLYGWKPHAVSLGWFQRAADFADLPPGTEVVRRLTGGGAIHHGDELTFALVLDAVHLPREVAASYRLLHDAAARALGELGVACERLAAGEPPSARPAERWCFRAPGKDDVVTARGKLLGSAQRRVQRPSGARVLHHGSIVLQRPALTPWVAATADSNAGDAEAAERLRRGLAAHFAAALGLELRPGELTAAELQLARELQERRYRQPAFTRQR
jgi:lipoate-protein ligase A